MSSSLQTLVADRETIQEPANPLGLNGIEFIEYTTAKPQALGQVLEMMGFRPIARHRSREIMLYRQGGMNVIVNAHIPAIHGVGKSRLYFVDRYDKFSIYDVDFVPIPTVDQHPPAVAGLHFFGIVQYIGNDRTGDWTEFYRELLGFTDLPDDQRFGILPKGRILQSPCPPSSRFFLQLIEPEASVLDVENNETLQRVGLGCPDVLAGVDALGKRGVEFLASRGVHTEDRGALTTTWMGSVSFELVHDPR